MILQYIPIVLPSILIVFSSIAVLYIDNGSRSRYIIAVDLSIGTLLVSFLTLIIFYGLGYYDYSIFSSTLYLSNFGYFIAISAILATIIVIYGGMESLEPIKTRSSFLSLAMLTDLGVIYLGFAYNVITILASWGIASAATYVIAMIRKDYSSTIAGVKYLIMGLLSSSLMVLGFAFFILGIGSLSLDATINYQTLVILGIMLLSVAFLFKVGAFPFQAWLPDVYSMSDRVSVAFVSSVGKIVGIAPLFDIVYFLKPSGIVGLSIFVIFALITVMSLIFGNIVAFSRQDFASMLAYSSITQVGFMLIAITMLPYNPTVSISGLMVYLLAYSIAQSGLFIALSHIEKVSGTSYIEGFRGMSSSDKALAFAVSVLLLSLLGIPPILGFWAKLFVLEASFSQPWLTIIGFLNSAVSAGYYIPPIREIFREGEFRNVNSTERDAVIIASILSIALGIVAPLIVGVIS
ncbi:NADH-quinone oxidoreductase subunit NuoN [Sulfolobus sp. S-194]|uniref:NADH-quinone oxidoreductase subunit NuoN n=1 Tax=Sulfolobus sp. S-194 TaxID=2512240 RepID=UPI001436DC73|nr:NADH-quinone oxidoreductase subunit NuoN [Sulfolobus sp. S-194]QIW25009.1 NADH-quinone oxidoreductase subunit NuoN [Sulfolobus sp. S-194]